MTVWWTSHTWLVRQQHSPSRMCAGNLSRSLHLWGFPWFRGVPQKCLVYRESPIKMRMIWESPYLRTPPYKRIITIICVSSVWWAHVVPVTQVESSPRQASALRRGVQALWALFRFNWAVSKWEICLKNVLLGGAMMTHLYDMDKTRGFWWPQPPKHD